MPKDEIKKINKRIRDLFTSKLGFVILNSADTVVISACLGLTVLAVYQNYYFILTSIIGFITIVFNSCTAGIGNSIVVETKEKNYKDLQKFLFLISWIAGVCVCCFLCLFQPFMEVWVGSKLMLELSAVVCFCIYFYLYEINALLTLYKDASGIWHTDRFRPLITAITNLTMNLIMVQFWGIYGVLLSTILSMILVGMPWLIHNLFTYVFEMKYLSDFLKKMSKYFSISLIACAITYFICAFFRSGAFATLFIRLCICIVMPNLIFFLTYRGIPEFKETLLLIEKITHGKVKLNFLIRG